MALTAWIWLSALWSVSPTLTLLDSQRALAYAAAAALAGFGLRRGDAPWVAAAIAAPATLIALYVLVRYAARTDLAEPIGYANALGMFCTLALLLAGALAVGRWAHGIRIAACASIVVLASVLVLASARGPLLALAAGGAIAAALGLRSRRAATAVLAATMIAAVLLAAALATVVPATFTTLRQEVATASPHDRDRYWSAAWDAARERPLLGAGAGTFERLWLEHRDVNLPVLDAHNLYLETLAELGPVGLALLGAALGIPLVAAVRARRRAYTPFVAGAYAAFLVHAAVDWDWEMPVLTIPAFVLGGALVTEASAPRARRGLPVAGAVALAVGVGAVAFVGLMANSALTAAVVALDRGDAGTGAREARSAKQWALWSAEPNRLLAEAAAARGDARSARAYAIATLESDPGNVRIWRLLARVSAIDRPHAYRRIAELDPNGPPPWAD